MSVALAERAMMAWAIVGTLAEMAEGQPGYNLAIPLFGLYALQSQSVRMLFLFLALTGLSAICDIVWCAVWGHLIDLAQGSGGSALSTSTFGLVMLVFCLFIKLGAGFFAFGIFRARGGWFAVTMEAAGAAGSNDPNKTDAYANMPESADNTGYAQAYQPDTSAYAEGGMAAGYQDVGGPVAGATGSSGYQGGM